ncbi:MAG: saccharopine dehydrogenase [Porticoccaceae bacterium]|nr:saccharopine dehydrogenase [Porticoccaceae bacterium]MBT5577119.1 saccharopine dehydrogenase [Porticoccaceae bacterium]MBT7375305.1 saccharopine dehydrogenase [Porticoccaceae bacterium]
MAIKKFDLVIFGATSFVGEILTNYLYEHIGLTRKVKWAIAGRSETKLNKLRDSLGEGAAKLPIIVADSKDEKALSSMCKKSRVIVSTVGPYVLYGEALVKACAENGNDYCDLTGEAYWIERMMLKYEDLAKTTGARIVNCCGFDSIPSDLGTHFLQQQGKSKFGEFFNSVKLRVKTMKGGASGGTIASMAEMVIAAKADPALRKAMGNPYILCPQQHSYSQRQVSIKVPEYDTDFASWAAPFIMEAINTRVVLRSNWLLNMAYGDDFTYGEAMLMGEGTKGRLSAYGLTAGLGALTVGMVIDPIRNLLNKFVFPKPGEGPSPQEQLEGHFDIRLLGKNKDSQQLVVKVTGDRDPGYGCTAKMLAQAGLCLAFDLAKGDKEGGFLTPAAAMGDLLIERLNNHAGMSFSVLD